MEYIEKMDMSYSYKPVFLKAYIDNMVENKAKVEDIVDTVVEFYEDRKNQGLIVEKKRSIYNKVYINKKENIEKNSNNYYTFKDAQNNILSNPFKRFQLMNFMRRTKDIEYIELNRHIYKKLSENDIKKILQICDENIEKYYLNLR